MTKERFLELYKELYKANAVTDMDIFYCLKLNGADDDKAFELIPTITDLWLHDSGNMSISWLCDQYLLYEGYIDEDMTDYEILELFYEDLC